MMDFPILPAMDRDNIANGVLSWPNERITSAIPGISFSNIGLMVSVVLSLGPNPVPPVVTIKSIFSFVHFAIVSLISFGSSGTILIFKTSTPSSFKSSAMIFPEPSSFFPAKQESEQTKIFAVEPNANFAICLSDFPPFFPIAEQKIFQVFYQLVLISHKLLKLQRLPLSGLPFRFLFCRLI